MERKTQIHKNTNTEVVHKIMINICSPWRERFWSRSLPPPRRNMKMVFESKLARPWNRLILKTWLPSFLEFKSAWNSPAACLTLRLPQHGQVVWQLTKWRRQPGGDDLLDYRRVGDDHVVDIVITPDRTALFGEVHPRVQCVAHLITWCSLLSHAGHYDDFDLFNIWKEFAKTDFK